MGVVGFAGEVDAGTFTHIWWSCNKIQTSWERIGRKISEFTNYDVKFSSQCFFLLNMFGNMKPRLKKLISLENG